MAALAAAGTDARPKRRVECGDERAAAGTDAAVPGHQYVLSSSLRRPQYGR